MRLKKRWMCLNCHWRPTLDVEDRSEFLFVRPDDYELFIQFGLTVRRSILLGNPGSSKSWFQWKFIVFCYRPDIFNALWKSDCVEKIPEANRADSEKKDSLSHFFMPEMIVRTIGGIKSYVFSIKHRNDVFEVSHKTNQLEKITPLNSTILWEPGDDTTPVHSLEIKGHIIATLSPDEDQYHQFQKVARTMYMVCPSVLQIRLMGQILRNATTNITSYPSDKEIYKRVSKHGPSIRASLIWSKSKLKGFGKKQKEEIQRICATESNLLLSLRSYDQIEETTKYVLEGLSHRLAMFAVKRSHPLRYYEQSMYFDFNNKLVLNSIYRQIAQLDIEALKRHLIKFNHYGLKYQAVLPKYLERIFTAHSASTHGFTWKAFPMRHRPHKKLNKSKGVKRCMSSITNEQPFSAQFDRVVRSITIHKAMEKKVLYFPSDPNFPFVDMYYKDAGNNLIGIQATISQRHERSFSASESFYHKLSTTSKQSPLQLYYFLLPRKYRKFAKRNYPPSQFFSNDNADEMQQWINHIQFYILIPPDDFEATFSKE